MTALRGTWRLVRLILRRDRWVLPLWVVLAALIPTSFAAQFAGLYPTAAERQEFFTVSAGNAGFTALYGRLLGPSLGELVTWRVGFVPMVVGLFSLLTVVRHTRAEEEAGRRELVGAAVVGRHAPLAAALVAAVAANVALAVLVALGVTSQDLPAAGSWALGLEFAAAGWVFAAVGAVAAQLTSSAGAARGIAVSTLGAAFVLRMAGDLSAGTGGGWGWTSWLSPIGLVQRIHPYSGEGWGVLVIAVAGTGVLAAAAVALSARRDLGAGVLPARSGPAAAAPALCSPLALAWRLHRSLLVAWTAGFAVLGVILGGLAESTRDLLGDNRNLRTVVERIGGRSGLVDAYLAAVTSLLGTIVAAYAIQAVLRLRAEEASGRAEPVLATAVGRLRWAGSHLAFSVLGPAVALTAAGAAAGLAHGLNTGDVGRELPRVLGAAAVQLPAVWVLAGITVALFGLLPRLAAVGWGVLVGCLLLGLVGAAVRLGQGLLDLSPFTHVPRLPGGSVSATPVLWLAVTATVLGAVGLIGLRRRTIPVG